jgi:hypothetical protein
MAKMPTFSSSIFIEVIKLGILRKMAGQMERLSNFFTMRVNGSNVITLKPSGFELLL